MLPQLEQELTGYNSLPCSITSSNYQEENAINLCNRLPLCYNIQSVAINASYNKEKNYNCVLFYSFGNTALETTRGSRVKLQWSNAVVVTRSLRLTFYKAATQQGFVYFLADYFYLFIYPAIGRPPCTATLNFSSYVWNNESL